ncbi:MAG: tRNA (adenosine(37)-N6)-threonylcarbamoyltransferase complex ATPase subunit type 1 TsaE [Helicobacter trogontum]|uniref:tRNA (adenosine(37)-N6)-threonylcarbamoyltransferase complex ATPase subunit type 1 TsaE n=1 Tax=Helicobacter trogontum TaxID=50960 RepID=UPI0024305E3D|nr:tRNA (adenosine(37)-N6)-threonylcarbamoyltransferase complex ATPase subunit type 1 TsaE [Helicobacter trogontum]MCI5787063.1 tRNA (adenosine(37)-N6)-threonylcarbamoyltransferase complex ATPase subunit type 1 TsaE [Helicobacter trogontum]
MQRIYNNIQAKDNLGEIIEFINLLQQKNSYTKTPINIILLKGQVGMGKSHLVHEYCKYKGIMSSSPTFAFLHEYGNEIFHYDLYLKNDEYAMIRLYESLANKGLHFVEWGSQELYLQLQRMGFSCVLLEILPTHDTNMRAYNFLV